jgi:hypothetical protein
VSIATSWLLKVSALALKLQKPMAENDEEDFSVHEYLLIDPLIVAPRRYFVLPAIFTLL